MKKKIIFYSKDYDMCVSLLMYLQEIYNVTTTTDINLLKEISENNQFDIAILDTEPSIVIESICKQLKLYKPELTIILTYVFRNQVKEQESNLRKYVDTIFYKPFDLNDISTKLSSLAV